MAKIEELQEKVDALENRVQLLEIIAKKQLVVETKTEPDETKKVIQINTLPKLAKARYNNKGELIEKEKVIESGKSYFCTTPQEQHIFSENNPSVETESFNVDLPVLVANEYLNDPENKKQFTKDTTGILVDAGGNDISEFQRK